jgi:hypothetical protein
MLHSLNAFAGRHVVDFTALAKANNAYWMEQEAPGMSVDIVKDYLLESTTDLEHGRVFGLSAWAIAHYISQNKQLFHLPDSCSIEAVMPLRSSEQDSLEAAIHYIDTHPSIHRVFSSSYVARHSFTFRKDLSGQWRVIDSWSIYHNTNEQNRLKELQPAFPTFRQAFEAHFTRLDPSKGRCELVYPTEDTFPSVSNTSPPAPAETAPTQSPIGKRKQSWPAQLWSGLVACFTRLWDCICACFCRRRGSS